MNMVGCLGWWVNANSETEQSEDQVKFFDSAIVPVLSTGSRGGAALRPVDFRGT
jgi:hypothetical protein